MIYGKEVDPIVDSYPKVGFTLHSTCGLPKRTAKLVSDRTAKNVNSITKVGKLPFPRLDDLLDSLAGGRVSSTFDLQSDLQSDIQSQFFQLAIYSP